MLLNLTEYFKSNFLDELKAFVASGSFKLLLILTALFIVFRMYIIDVFYTQYVIDGVLSKIKSEYYTNIVFGSFFIGISAMAFYRILKKKRRSAIYFLYAIAVFSIYLHYRNNNRYNCEFFAFEYPYHIRYSDIIILWFSLTLLEFVLGIYFRFSEPTYNSNPFVVDVPINDSSQDLFGRKQFAELIAKKVTSKYENASSFAIGIDSPWGSGKTSFIKMIREAIKASGGEKDRIIIEFHPWRSSNPRQIIADFFGLFTSEIEQISPNLSRKIQNYAKTLTTIDENVFTKSIDIALSIFGDEPSKEGQLEIINEALKVQNKQIIVFIDDVDRLDKKEVAEVIRLIRNTASFNNTVFIVTYEKEYIQNAIKSLNGHNYKQYLDKIFQFEFALTPIKKAILKRRLLDLLTQSITYGLLDSHKEGMKALLSMNDEPSIHPTPVSLFDKYIFTYRDVIRYVNSFLTDYTYSKDHIKIEDFAVLQLLKLRYKNAYDVLYNKRDYLFKVESSTFYPNTLMYTLNLHSSEVSEGKNHLKEYLLSNCSDIKYKDCEVDDIYQLTTTLFKTNLDDGKNHEPDKKSIRLADNFRNYFSASYVDEDISTHEFETAFHNMSVDEFKEQINEWVKKDLVGGIIRGLSRINLFELKTKEAYHKLIESVLYFTYRTAKPGARYMFNMERFQMLVSTGLNSKYSGYGEEEHLAYLKDILKKAKAPYLYESFFIKMLRSKYHEPYSVETIDEFADIQRGYIKNYLNTVNDFDEYLWALLYDSKMRIQLQGQPGIVEVAHPEIRPLITAFIEHNNLIDQFLLKLVLADGITNDVYYLNSQPILAIFEDFKVFESYLKKQLDNPKSKYIKEFIDFFTKVKNTRFEGYVTFDFKDIPKPKKQ